MHSIAGEAAVHGSVINLTKAYDRENFNQAIDRKTGYRTRSMLVVPIRKTLSMNKGGDEDVVNSLVNVFADRPKVLASEPSSV